MTLAAKQQEKAAADEREQGAAGAVNKAQLSFTCKNLHVADELVEWVNAADHSNGKKFKDGTAKYTDGNEEKDGVPRRTGTGWYDGKLDPPE